MHRTWCPALISRLYVQILKFTIVASKLYRGNLLCLYEVTGATTSSDTYLTVMCSVYDAHTGTKLWPNANTPEENIVQGSTYGNGLLKFPLSTTSFNEWQPGYQYVYNVVINSNTEMGAIEFGDPSVDTFVNIETNYH